MLNTLFRVVFLMALPYGVMAQGTETGFLDRELTDGEMVRTYQIFVPREYDPANQWPVILFLHGGGEEGTDGIRPTAGGLGEAIRRNPERFSAVVVFPQVRPDHQWTGPEAAFAMQTLEAAQREFSLDPDRVYLTGLSRGARGVYYIAYRHATRFAAVLAVCGFVSDGEGRLAAPLVVPREDGDPFGALAGRLSETPLWIFHGEVDPLVPVEESRRLFSELRQRNAPARYSELPGVGHRSWDAAYQKLA